MLVTPLHHFFRWTDRSSGNIKKSWKIPWFSDSKIYFSMVSINGDTPFHGIMENPKLKWMITGGTPHSRKPPYRWFSYVFLLRCHVLELLQHQRVAAGTMAPGVAEAGVVPAAVPCFKSNEPPLGSMNGWYSWWLNNDIMIINGIYHGINKRAK